MRVGDPTFPLWQRSAVEADTGEAPFAPSLAMEGLLPPQEGGRDRRALLLALCVAASAHAGAFILATAGAEDRFGARGTSDDAVSIEVSFASVGAPVARATDGEGQSEAAGPAAGDRLKEVDVQPETAVQASSAARRRREESREAQIVPEAAAEPASPPVREATTKPTETAAPSPPGSPSPTTEAPAVVMASVEPLAAASAVEASAGEINAYSRDLVGVLAKSRVSDKAAAGLGRGTAWIVFEVTRQGWPINVRVRRSSGNARLDKMAMESVGSARLPVPPANASVTQLLFELPYHFR